MIDWDETISDELLAAYLDGNTTPEENFRVEKAIEADGSLQELTDIVSDASAMQEQIEAWNGDYGFWELGIDPVFSFEELHSLVDNFTASDIIEHSHDWRIDEMRYVDSNEIEILGSVDDFSERDDLTDMTDTDDFNYLEENDDGT